MKKIFLLFSFLLFSTCAQPIDTSSWQTYQNDYYHFQISYPEDYMHCLNAYCLNEVPEDALATFFLAKDLGEALVTIQPYKNETGMSAMEYGTFAADYNEGVSDIENITFAGQDAFAFTIENSYLEPGGVRSVTENGYMSLTYDPEAIEVPLVDISEKSRVIYLDYGDYFYRIVYSDNETAEAIAESLVFLE